jgi:L-asparaginase / beta-aspartyl-peptidase
MIRSRIWIVVLAALPTTVSLSAHEGHDRVPWALAIHGGAGTIPQNTDPAESAAYVKDLEKALELGRKLLEGGASSLDTVEKVVVFLEDSPLFNAGKGAVFTHDGHHELDAAIMDGTSLACGAVAGLRQIRNPINLARLVLERSPHVFMIGAGAEAFAQEQGLAFVKPDYFFTQKRHDQLQEALRQEKDAGKVSELELPNDRKYSTVGAVALDRQGRLAAATSTGGMTNKRWGRVGDVPVIGAGTYANDRTAAISCSGKGEYFIRHTVAHDVSALIEYRGLSVQAAAEEVVHKKLKVGDGGLIAVGHDGSIALVFNTTGFYRGAADGRGRFEVKIWQ